MLKKVIRFLYSQKIDLHSDILSLKEIQSAIKSVVETHEEKFIQQIKVGQYNPQLWLKIKRHYIEPNDAIRIIKILGEQEQSQKNQLLNKTQTTQELIKNDIYNYFIKYFSKKYEKLSFSQIAIILEQYAYVKRFDQEFFRIMENEIYDRLSDKNEIIKYQDVEKILWAYQYCHYGSAILYGQLAQIIRIAQHEINPIKLAYYSYLYSKCPDNQRGGFGIYAITEKQVQQRIRDYNFSDFIKLAQYIFVPNICSNAFQLVIEEQLAQQFPSNKNLLPHDLVKLCKATMNYYFKYNDKSLQHKIEGACIELIDKVNDKQFCIIFWSYLKSRKGNAELYKKFSEQLILRQNLLSLRQLTLLYLNASNNSETFDLTKQLNQIIIKKINEQQQQQQQIKPTYLAYITIASMQSKLETPIKLTSDHLKMISTPLKVAILQTLQMSLPHLEQIKLSILLIQNLQEIELPYEDQVILQYCKKYFYKFCTQSQINIKQTIHKSLFHQALYLDPKNEHLHNQLIVLNQQYKDEMRFFFKQDNWVVISWCLLQQHLLNKERTIKKELIQEASYGIKELDINTIFHIEKYVQSLWMVILIEKLNIEVGIQKISEFIKISHYAQTSVLLNNFKDTQLLELKNVLKLSLEQQCQEINLKQEFNQSYINMFDQNIGMMLHVTHLIKTKTQDLKFGLIVLDSSDFEVQLNEEIQIKLGEQDFNILKNLRKERQIQRLIYEQLFDWNLEYIYIDEFQKYSKEKQVEYFKNIFALNPLDETDVEQRQEKRAKKGLNFQDRLNSLNRQRNKNRYLQTEANDLIEYDLNFEQ